MFMLFCMVMCPVKVVGEREDGAAVSIGDTRRSESARFCVSLGYKSVNDTENEAFGKF